MKQMAQPTARTPNATGETVHALFRAFPSRLRGVFRSWCPRRRFDIALVKLSSSGEARPGFGSKAQRPSRSSEVSGGVADEVGSRPYQHCAKRYSLGAVPQRKLIGLS